MLADLVVSCERCDAPLGEAKRRLTLTSPEGVRHAYECDCGAVTITISSADPA